MDFSMLMEKYDFSSGMSCSVSPVLKINPWLHLIPKLWRKQTKKKERNQNLWNPILVAWPDFLLGFGTLREQIVYLHSHSCYLCKQGYFPKFVEMLISISSFSCLERLEGCKQCWYKARETRSWKSQKQLAISNGLSWSSK